MVKELDVQNVKVLLRTDGALPIVYRNIFGRDFFMDEARITRYNTTTDFTFSEIYDIIFAMAKHAGYRGNEIEWYAQFPQIVDIYSLWAEAAAMLNEDFATKKE